jgi:hypothetical protein
MCLTNPNIFCPYPSKGLLKGTMPWFLVFPGVQTAMKHLMAFNLPLTKPIRPLWNFVQHAWS